MRDDLRHDVLQRLESDYGLKPRAGNYMRGGECPKCKKKELYTRHDNPWMVICGRQEKCGHTLYVKELYDDLFEDWSKRSPATESDPTATARAYLEFSRGFKYELIAGWFTQDTYFSGSLNAGTATVRFALERGSYWERLIDQPQRFGKMKARFAPGDSYRGVWWCPPCVDVLEVEELWIVEGIFDAIALVHNNISAVSAMSSNAFPIDSLKALASQRAGKLPKLIWALDNEPGAHAYTRRWVHQARELGFVCEAAQIPQRDGRKTDWNDLHQRWVFIDGDDKRTNQIAADLKQARHQGALLIAENAAEKALLMYDWNKRGEFHLGFGNRLYWFKLDMEKFNRAMQDIEDSEDQDDQLLNQAQARQKALQQSGSVVEIANCYPQALYYQRNEITDEAWYYVRVDFPHDGGSVKNTFTSSQLAAASEFKKRLLGMAAGAMYTGTGQQLDKLMKDQLYGIKSVSTIDYVGYSKEHGCYIFGDVAIKDGVAYQVNNEDYFEFGKLRLKTLQKGIAIKLVQDAKGYNEEWLRLLWICFGAQGIVALVWFFGSLFCEQIRGKFQSYPFMEATGEAGAGKTTLLNLLWKLLGREGYEGFDPMKSTKAGRSRLMAQVSGMPVVFLEADRHGDEKSHAKAFEWDELKDFYGGGTLATKGVKTAGNETYEPPFRGAIAISQNAAVVAHEAIMTRITKLHFLRPTVTPESRKAADQLNALDGAKLSHFLLLSIRKEAEVMSLFSQRMPEYESKLRRLHTHCFACESAFPDENSTCSGCGNKLRGYIRVERISKNHAQLLALLDCICMVLKLQEHQVNATRFQIVRMAIERQASISSDHPAVAEFWEVYEYLQSLSEDPVVDHSADTSVIAINLNEFSERAAEHKQKLADVGTLRDLLRESRSHRFIENKAVHSAVRAAFNNRNPLAGRPTTVKCWIFKK
ncbi:toprim domain-containing protein [Pseudomonas sp. PCH199]|uniref:toprim domain-containing protein n=1 Tax=unclassified Pseudomonas TaxID=196821 RepID=UPI000BC382C1|nr:MULTISPECIES: toprim domain-containing protein [unclassified Pseudomonas]MCW8275553.1 toprim domain-containing protein [Pseudomonas sp. PCH199]PAM84428.1 bifunctional DNA primase/helicase [Pseudomonas sp. ERMR1:02]